MLNLHQPQSAVERKPCQQDHDLKLRASFEMKKHSASELNWVKFWSRKSTFEFRRRCFVFAFFFLRHSRFHASFFLHSAYAILLQPDSRQNEIENWKAKTIFCFLLMQEPFVFSCTTFAFNFKTRLRSRFYLGHWAPLLSLSIKEKKKNDTTL